MTLLTLFIFTGEVNDLDQDNIISDGSERAAKPTEFKGDEQLDAQVEEVAKSDGKWKRFGEERSSAHPSSSAEGMA